MYLIIGYFVIGLFIGINHLSSGKVGEIGPMGTLIAHVLLWPLLLLIRQKKSSRL